MSSKFSYPLPTIVFFKLYTSLLLLLTPAVLGSHTSYRLLVSWDFSILANPDQPLESLIAGEFASPSVFPNMSSSASDD